MMLEGDSTPHRRKGSAKFTVGRLGRNTEIKITRDDQLELDHF